MKRSLWWCLAATALTVFGAHGAEVAAVVHKPVVGVRAEPRLEAQELTQLTRETVVSVTAQRGLWYELKLADGRTGFVRVNDLRLEYRDQEDDGAVLRALTGGKAGEGRVMETAGVRGIDESDLRSAALDAEQLNAMTANRAEHATSVVYARLQGWQATAVPYDAEARPSRDETAADAGSVAAAAQSVSGMMGSFGEKVGSFLGQTSKVTPRAEQEQAAEELALGPQIAGRVLGARPLWADAEAQRRVNLVGRWVASQTSRPDLPWVFGVIDTPEINAFAAPGGYVLVTRGLYGLLSSDSEIAAVLGHEISHCVQRDHYEVIRKQELAALGKDAVSRNVETGSDSAEGLVREYVERHGATILMTSLDREAEYRADYAAEVYLARSGLNPMTLYAVLQKMAALGTGSASLTQLYKTHPPLEARMDRLDQRGYADLESYISRE